MTASATVSVVATTANSRRPAHRPVLRRGVPLLLGMLILSSGPAMAATFCVATGNELASALETAAFNGQNDEIRIRTGTLVRTGLAGTVPRWPYDMGAGGPSDTQYSITISGGWTSCSTQVKDPRLTVLDAQNQGTGMYLQMYNNDGAVTLSNFTITRGLNPGNLASRAAANLSVSAPYSTSTILLDRLIIVAGTSIVESGIAAGVELRGFGDGFGGKPGFTLRNSVIAYNTARNVAGLDVSVADAVVSLTNNSIFSNTSTVALNCRCTGVNLTNDITTYVSSNVIVDNLDDANRPSDVRNFLGNTYMRNNHIGNLLAEVPPVFNLAMTSGNPNWTIAGIYPTPNPGSPLRDSGYNTPASGVGTLDLAGNTRITGGTIDRGAIEAAGVATDLIFADGFQ